MLRQFHVEGFVNEYTLDSVSENGKVLEFVAVRIENIPPLLAAPVPPGRVLGVDLSGPMLARARRAAANAAVENALFCLADAKPCQ